MNEGLLDRYAELIVGFGANVQPDQVVAVEAAPEAAPFVRRIARLAYARGARYVDVVWLESTRRGPAATDSPAWPRPSRRSRTAPSPGPSRRSRRKRGR